MNQRDTTKGEISFDTLRKQIQHDVNSPLYLSEGPGIVTLRSAQVMPDGKMYIAVYSDNWITHVNGYQPTRGRSNNEQTALDNPNNYALVALHGEELTPALTIPGHNVGGFCISQTPPDLMNKEIFNATNFWNQGGLSRYGQFTRGDVQRGRELVGST